MVGSGFRRRLTDVGTSAGPELLLAASQIGLQVARPCELHARLHAMLYIAGKLLMQPGPVRLGDFWISICCWSSHNMTAKTILRWDHWPWLPAESRRSPRLAMCRPSLDSPCIPEPWI